MWPRSLSWATRFATKVDPEVQGAMEAKETSCVPVSSPGRSRAGKAGREQGKEEARQGERDGAIQHDNACLWPLLLLKVAPMLATSPAMSSASVPCSGTATIVPVEAISDRFAGCVAPSAAPKSDEPPAPTVKLDPSGSESAAVTFSVPASTIVPSE